MFSRLSSREEQVELLHFAIELAKSNKVLIEELENFEVEYKSNGTIHKTKENRRLALIKGLKTENKKLKKFFHENQKHLPVYPMNKKISELREHLLGRHLGSLERKS